MEDMIFNYFIGDESEQFNFIKVPKIFFTDDRFGGLSFGAKILYGLLLDRISLSRKNKWHDEQKRVYVIYTIEGIQEDFHVSKTVAVRLLKELEEFGLIEKKRRPNAAAMIYVKNFILPEENAGEETGENSKSPEVQNMEVRKMEVQNMEVPESRKISGSPENGSPKNKLPEVQKMESNNTNKNKTDNNISSSSVYEKKEKDMKMMIQKRIGYDQLVKDVSNRRLLEEMVNELVHIFCSDKSGQKIGNCFIPMERIRMKILDNLSEENFRLIQNNILDNGVETIYNLQNYIIVCFYNLLKLKGTRGQKTTAGFRQNQYDFEELEKDLLAVQRQSS